MSDKLKPTDKTTLKRIPKRGNFDREVINSILDEAFICHVGFVADGQPYVIPTAYGRVGNDLYVHGSSASRLMRSLADGIDICVTVTLIDGLVLARSAFHHSINYRSIVIIGNAEMVTGDDEKRKALESFTEHLIPGRWNDVRPPTDLELKATIVLRLPINEASAKMRTGDPVDDEADYSLNVWAGVLPLALKAGEPIPDARLDPNIEPQEYVQRYKRF
ncbi:MAG: pyridoxamine 5'-phosphate oxidase family protein [Pyrinomonadaceae bacterium]|nr:pyridoxamine 5'-phosphate oxidase family protein [Pyrinomonadaceae bacterium]